MNNTNKPFDFRGGKIPPNDRTGDFFEVLHEAIAESVRRQIKADTIILSPHIGFSFYRGLDGCEYPMICGMNVVIANVLPAGVDFAIVKSGKDDELFRFTKEELEFLRANPSAIDKIIGRKDRLWVL